LWSCGSGCSGAGVGGGESQGWGWVSNGNAVLCTEYGCVTRWNED